MSNPKKNTKVRLDDIMQQSDIAGIFGVSKTTISKWNASGLIPDYTVGSLLRFAVKFGKGEVKVGRYSRGGERA